MPVGVIDGIVIFPVNRREFNVFMILPCGDALLCRIPFHVARQNIAIGASADMVDQPYLKTWVRYHQANAIVAALALSLVVIVKIIHINDDPHLGIGVNAWFPLLLLFEMYRKISQLIRGSGFAPRDDLDIKCCLEMLEILGFRNLSARHNQVPLASAPLMFSRDSPIGIGVQRQSIHALALHILLCIRVLRYKSRTTVLVAVKQKMIGAVRP